MTNASHAMQCSTNSTQPSITFTVSVYACFCMDASELAATPGCLKLNIAALSQTE